MNTRVQVPRKQAIKKSKNVYDFTCQWRQDNSRKDAYSIECTHKKEM